MKTGQHLIVGRLALDEINKSDDKIYKIYKKIFLFGNIAPDINCIYPAHRLTTTEKRFYKKLNRIKTTKFNVIRSFELGTLMHYICDYFCYPHAIESIGVKHRKYEYNLYKYFKNNIDNIINNDNNDILDINKIQNSCDEIMAYIKNTLEQYKKDIQLKNSEWTDNIKQISMDLKYSTVITENILRYLVLA